MTGHPHTLLSSPTNLSGFASIVDTVVFVVALRWQTRHDVSKLVKYWRVIVVAGVVAGVVSGG